MCVRADIVVCVPWSAGGSAGEFGCVLIAAGICWLEVNCSQTDLRIHGELVIESYFQIYASVQLKAEHSLSSRELGQTG